MADVNSPLCEFRNVVLYWDNPTPMGGATTSYLVHMNDVDKLVKVMVELHYNPGINPHNKRECAKIHRIDVTEMFQDGPFWWSTPGLTGNDDPNGVPIYNTKTIHIAWMSPVYQAKVENEWKRYG